MYANSPKYTKMYTNSQNVHKCINSKKCTEFYTNSKINVQTFIQIPQKAQKIYTNYKKCTKLYPTYKHVQSAYLQTAIVLLHEVKVQCLLQVSTMYNGIDKKCAKCTKNVYKFSFYRLIFSYCAMQECTVYSEHVCPCK